MNFQKLIMLGLFTSFSFNAYSEVTDKVFKKVEVLSPYLTIGCSKIGVDEIGTLALKLKKIETAETSDSLNINLYQSVLTCAKNSQSKEIGWQAIDLFSGEERQFYNGATKKLDVVVEKLVTSESFKGVLADTNSNLIEMKSVENLNGKLTKLSFSLDKTRLFDQNEIDALKNKKMVKKAFELSYNLVHNTFYQGSLLTDKNLASFSGRKILISFKKVDKLIIVDSIAEI